MKKPEALATVFKVMEKDFTIDTDSSGEHPRHYAAPKERDCGLGITIYEAWRWAPLEPSPTLWRSLITAAGNSCRPDFYYQDGRREYDPYHLERMRRFVEHLTTIDLKAYDEFIKTADKSGPGMIHALARFCHPGSQVEVRPNIGNLLGAVTKKSPLTRGEIESAVHAFSDPSIRKEFINILKHR